ncbi:MAG TPA: cytochrome c oxidase accessory protein CcoG, partial [Burkholderiaceae bacterium]|nr:cytochrome c oxidase accessory protein CcoG [Burkholderiaceae bacterium]
RLWCGYACPQTVYTSVFMWIERVIEGDRAQRMALDRAPGSLKKYALKAGKHAAWIAVALWTGFTFVGYFTPIQALAQSVWTLQVGNWAIFWMLFYALATYGNAGWLREQVCIYMCPYARFQSAMFDQDTLIVTYDTARGEPRGMGTKDRAHRGLGDCVDCGLCVQVCPTGIDIREGLQYECIGCAACIDACNVVMEKTGQEKGLIRYSTDNALAHQYSRWQVWQRVLRPRTLIYGALLGGVCVALAAALWLRVPLKVDVVRDRHAFAREVIDARGHVWVENTYRLIVMNTLEKDQRYTISASGLPTLRVAEDSQMVDVPAASTRSVALRLRADQTVVQRGSHPVMLEIVAVDQSEVRVREHTRFLGGR